MDMTLYALLNKKINGVASGVSSVVVDGTTLKFTFTNGSTAQMSFPAPKDGAGVQQIEINSSGHLICTMTDGTKLDAGAINTTLSSDLTANTVVGGVSVGTKFPAGTPLETIIRAMLVTYQKPGISIAINPTKTVYNLFTQTLSSIDITANVTKKSKDITSVKFYVAGVEVFTKTTGVTSGGAFTYTHNWNTPTNTDTTFKVTASDGDSTVEASTKIQFVAPSYYGFVPATVSAPTASDIQGLQNSIAKTSRALTYSDILMTNSRIVYAYPKSQGALVSIVDKSGYDYKTSYTQTEVTINGFPYYCYTLTNPATIETSGFKQIYG